MMSAITRSRPSSSPILRRSAAGSRCACGGTIGADGMCDQCRQRALQRRAAAAGPATAPPIVHDVLRGAGRPLDPAVRARMEPSFGHSFAHVRVHDDARAAESARAVDAHAYTVGDQIVFGAGRYAPETRHGAGLLAHELAHVVQQRGTAGAAPQRLAMDHGPADAWEGEAARAADRVMEGRAVGPLSAAPGAVRRAMICSKRLEAPVAGWFANHAYIDDTGRNDCLGSGMPGNYAVQTLTSGNFYTGCAAKTSTSTDPQSYTPNRKPCTPKPGVTDVSACLAAAYAAYNSPGLYSNPNGPNSNTFAYTLASACCADASDSGLGWVPGWGKPPAPPCPPPRPETPSQYIGYGETIGPDGIVRVGLGGAKW